MHAWILLCASALVGSGQVSRSPAPQAEVGTGEVLLDVSPARIDGVAAGRLESEALAVLDSAGVCHVLLRERERWRALSAELPVSRPAQLALGDVDPALAGAELYALGAQGDLWQVLPLTWSGGLQVRRIELQLPARATFLVAGRFDLRAARRQLLLGDESGRLDLLEATVLAGFRRRPLADSPGVRSQLWLDLETQRGIVCGVADFADDLLVSDPAGRLLRLRGFPERIDARELARGAERVLCFGALTRGERAPAYLFAEGVQGDVLALYWREASANFGWEPVVEDARGLAGALAAPRPTSAEGERLWLLDRGGSLSRATRTADGWTSEVIARGDAPAHGPYGMELDGPRPEGEAHMVVAWESRLVDLGAP